MLATIPRGTPAVHLPFKGFSNRQAQHSSRVLQSLVCGSQPPPPPHPSPPSESIDTVCVFCTLRQKRYSFNCALALWRGLNGAAHSCGNYKNQRRGKRHAGSYCCFRILRKQKRSGFCTQFAKLSSTFACLWKSAEAILWKVLGEQVQRNKPTSSGRKAGFKDSSLIKRGSLAEMQTPSWRPPSL